MLGSLDPAKVLVILVIALVVLGPERLPKAARQMAGAWRELTRLRDQVSDEVRSAMPELDLPRLAPGAVSGFLRDLTSSPSAQVAIEADAERPKGGTLVAAETLSHSAATSTGGAPRGSRGDPSLRGIRRGDTLSADDPSMN